MSNENEEILTAYREYAKILRRRLYPHHLPSAEDGVPNIEKYYSSTQQRSTERAGKPRDIILAEDMRMTPKRCMRWPAAIEWRPSGSGLLMSTWTTTEEEKCRYPFGRVALMPYVRWVDDKGAHGFVELSAFESYALCTEPVPLSEQALLTLTDANDLLRRNARYFLLGKLDGVIRSSTPPTSSELPTETLLALIRAVPAWLREFEALQNSQKESKYHGTRSTPCSCDLAPS